MDFTTEALELGPNKYNVPEEEPSEEHVPEEVVEPSKYGDKLEYDPSGPFEKHRYRTDLCWLVTFLVFLVVWLIVISYAFSKGDVSKWSRPMDSVGRICGEDPDVQDRPYLVHYNQDTCSLPDCLVCVASCPESEFVYTTPNDDRRKREVGETSKGASSDHDTGKSSENQDKKSPESTADVSTDHEKVAENKEPTKTDANEQNKPTSTQTDANGENKKTLMQTETNEESKNTLKQAETNEESKDKSEQTVTDEQNQATSTESKTNEESKKPSPETRSEDDLKFRKRRMICQPEVKLDKVNTWQQLDFLVYAKMCAESYKHTPLIDGRCSTKNETYSLYPSNSKYSTPKETSNFFSSKWSILGFILLSGLFAMMIIFLLRFGMGFIYGTISILCAFIIFFYYDQFVIKAESKTLGVFLTLVLCVVTIGILAALLLYFRREVCRTAQIMKESHKAIMCIMSTLFLPFILFIFYMLIFFLGISVFFTLASIEVPVYKASFSDDEVEICQCSSDIKYWQGSVCVPETFNNHCKTPEGNACLLSGCFMSGKEPKSMGFLYFLNFVGIFWSFYFIVGFGDMILAHVFTTWYWTYNKKLLSYLSVIESFWTVSTFHLGTVAVGSLIIPICSFIRFLLSALYKRLQKSGKPWVQFIVLNLKFIFDLIDGFLDFINRRAYIMCAIHGTDYFQSARTAYYLIMRNIARVVVVCGITEYMIFMVTLLISGITTKIAQAYYNSVYDDTSLIIFAVFAGSFIVTWLLMRVVQMAIDTIFICFLEDSERNDGSNEKPYFMTEPLIKSFYKK